MIEIHDLFCLYALPSGDAVAALRGLSLTVAAGEAVALVGPNGAGKSTLVRVVTGEVGASAGTVSIDGRPPGTVVRRDLLGIIDQQSMRTLRPELSTLENVALQSRLSGVSRAEALDRAAAVLTELGVDATDPFADGAVHRVAIAAALAHGPRVIVADEPTSGLAPESAEAVLQLLRRAVSERGASLLLVTHDPATAAIADRVVRIRDGRISEEWRPGEPERSVVDDRGWLRLPERERTRMGRLIVSEAGPDGVRLTPAEAPSGAADPDLTVPVAATTPLGPVVEATGLRVHRGGRTLPLPSSLRLETAGVTIVSGPSGAGKSTLLDLIAGFVDADEGDVRVAGASWRGLSRSDRAVLRRRWVAIVQERTTVADELDAAANLLLARQVRGLGDASSEEVQEVQEVQEVLDLMDLTALAGRPAGVLSGGERQRLALARAIDSGRPLLLLDDPTSQQDEAHAGLVARVLRESAAAGRTIFVATHDPLVAAIADQAIVLENPAPST